MLKSTKKTAIIRHFIASMLLVSIILLAFGLNMDDSFAVELNETSDEVEMQADIEDTLENSQNDNMEVESQNGEVMNVENRSDEVLRAVPYVLDGGTFRDIQDTVDAAEPGSRIVLNGYFSSTTTADEIVVNKELTFVSTTSATLDALNKCRIFSLNPSSSGTSIHNIKFVNGVGDYGGAILIKSNDIVINNCIFDKNHAWNGGGAIKAPNDYQVGMNTVIKNCEFTNNYAKEASGAVSLPGNNTKIINCSFISNRAVNSEGAVYGGAISIGSDIPNCVGYVRNCTFIGNSATSKGHSHGGAGCIRSGIQYIDCKFINNLADEGGALTYHGSGTIRNCVFINNSAKEFGGALSTGFLINGQMHLIIRNCVFEGNEAPLGGAVQLVGTNIKIEKSNFSDNHASINGGAANMEAESVTLINCNLNGNIAEADGGAVFIHGGSTLITKSSFINNSAIPDYDKYDEGLGGAVYVNSTDATIESSSFLYNTARNGSAVYYDRFGENLILNNNTMYQNQAWVYHLPIFADDILYEDTENITVIIHGGNNIAKYGDLSVSNAIYNAADYSKIKIDGQSPVDGATDSGVLYQDDREYNIGIFLTVEKDDGTMIYNDYLNSSYLGEISQELYNLQPGKYYVTAKHLEDTYYKGITNATTFTVNPKTDSRVLKTAKSDESFNYEDLVVWTLNITNNGPNNATGVTVTDVLPEGLIWYDDDTDGAYDPKTGILYIGDLEVGQTVIFNIITIINKTGELVNKVNITSNEYDYNISNNYDEENISVLPASDLEVIKTVDNSNPNYLDWVTWTIVVKNKGPDAATAVVLNDVLPKGLIWVNNTGNYDHDSGVWEIGTMNPGDEVSFNIVCRVNATGDITNEVSVESPEFDYDTSNNHDFEMIHVRSSSDLSIVKSVNASEADLNDYVKWILVISNNGPDIATGVRVTDVLPKGFVYVGSNLERGSYLDGTIDIGEMAVGETLTLEITCRVDETGEFVNVANITGNEYDYNMSNNQDDESIYINPACDMEVIKMVNNTAPDYMDYVQWIIIVKNNGPDVASDVVVMDILPKSLIWISDTSNNKYDHNTGKWTIGQLGPDESVRLSIVTQVNATGIIVNNVSVSAHEFDYDMSNNADNESIEVESTVDVEITKTVNVTGPNYGDVIKWTLTAKNHGPDKATGVYVQDYIPNGLEILNATASKGFYDNGIWAVCCLENGEVETLEIICRVTKTGTITNVASINSTEVDFDPTNNRDDETINVPSAVDLEVTKEVTNKNPLFGETVTWLISVKNNGPDAATNVVLYDVLDEGLIFKGYVATTGQYSNNEWTVGNLAPGQIEYLNITCEVNKLAVITNEAYANSSEYDIDKSNNRASEFISSIPIADLSVIKEVNNTSPNYGDFVKWTIIVRNNGPNNATNIEVKDMLPNGLTLVRASEGMDASEKWVIEMLSVGQAKKFEVVCKVTSTGTFKNSVSVKGDEVDPNMDNNNAESSILVKPASDLSITKTVSKYRYTVGNVIRYSVKVANNGPDSARNIQVSEIFDEDSLSLKTVKATKGSYDKSNNTWSIPSLDNGKMANLYINALAKTAGKVKNTVSVSSDTFDHNKSNNVDKVVVDVAKKEKADKNDKKDKKDKKDEIIKKPAETGQEPKVFGSSSKTKEMVKMSKALSKQESTGNPFAILLSSLLFSLVFLAGHISKKR